MPYLKKGLTGIWIFGGKVYLIHVRVADTTYPGKCDRRVLLYSINFADKDASVVKDIALLPDVVGYGVDVDVDCTQNTR